MRTLLTSLPIAGVLLLSACTDAGHEDPMAAQHREMMMADSTAKADMAAQQAAVNAMTDMFNTGSTDGMDKYMTDNFTDHQQDTAIKATGMEGAKAMIAMVRTAFPDFKQEIVGMSTTGDHTYAQVHMTGTNTGAWGTTMPATGKTMDVMGCDVFRCENGKVAEHWGYMEEMKMMQQLGMMPAPGAMPAKKK